MHQCTLAQRSGAAGALRLAGMCTPTVCHMHMHMCAHLLTACRYTGSIGLFLCRNNLFLDHGGLLLLAGLQPLSAAHRLELLWKDPKVAARSSIMVPFWALFLVKNRKGGIFNIFNVEHISLTTSTPSHRRHDQRLSLTLTGCPPKAAVLERVDPAHRSVLLPPPHHHHHSELYQFPFIFFYHQSKSVDHNSNTLLSCT